MLLQLQEKEIYSYEDVVIYYLLDVKRKKKKSEGRLHLSELHGRCHKQEDVESR